MVFYPMPQFLGTSKHSSIQDVHGFTEALRTSSQVDFPVSPSPTPANAQAPLTSATSGQPPLQPFASYDRASASWRTYQDLLLADISTQSSVTLPKAGMTAGGVCYLQPNWVRRISVIASGLWPTPREGKVSSENEETWLKRYREGKVHTPPLALAVKMERWATPSATDGERGGRMTPNMTGQSLPQQVKSMQQWHTPTAYDANDVKRTMEGWEKRAKFRQSIGRDHIAPAGLSEQIWLEENKIPLQFSKWPTPTEDDANNVSRGSGDYQSLTRSVQERTEAGGKLNPRWVEWLMNWPIGWASLEPLAMDRFQLWRQQRGCC